MFQIKLRFKIKYKVMAVFIMLAILSFISGTTSSPVIIIVNSFLINFIKMFAVVEFVLPIMMMLSSDGNKGRFYSIFYPFAISLSQLMGYIITTFTASNSDWQYVYILFAAISLIMALLFWIFMHEQYLTKPVPLYYIDWLSILLLTVSCVSAAYVFSFGKQQDWLNSKKIILGVIISLLSFITLIGRQFTLKRPYLSFKMFKLSSVRHGLLMLFFLGMYLALGGAQSSFAVGILGYSPERNASLNVLMIPGIIGAGCYAAYWFSNSGRSLKIYIFTGFSAMLGYTIIMYFSMVSEFNYGNWLLPMFLKGFGMGSLFISVWYYTFHKVDANDILPAVGLVLMWRTFITVGIFSVFFSWLQYQFQIHSLGDMAVYLDGNIISSQDAFANLKGMQLNAILAANKKLFGYVCIVGIGVLLYILTYHFEEDSWFSKLDPKVKQRKQKEQKEQIKDAAGAVI